MENFDHQIVREFRDRLDAMMPVLDLRVFGSRARGNAQEDSDLDIFLKVPELDRPLREQIYDLAWEIGFKYDRIISTFVVTEDQITAGAVGASPVLAKILEEGIAV
ncbi:nucleotidyltransferase family protein [Picosynechococcus sp. NKBG042902]|uniref:nucleotidyltransferase family protein n=1 Tax=Picosynechococcus sp. NKBG042902 TaxID=490193 RepID=UPI0004AAA10D|nr:nucleotidyltransferase domain-containing protein [Picosynechococcus sp. NKBG042902]